MLTVFNAIPYPNSPLYNEHEFHGSTRQSQFSFLAEGNIDPVQKLAAYLETDFLAVGLESNYLSYQRLGSAPAARLYHRIAAFENAPQPGDRCLIQMFPNHSFCRAPPCRMATTSIPPSDRLRGRRRCFP
jgi:hypothetical protein